jgi:hypothetical protein
MGFLVDIDDDLGIELRRTSVIISDLFDELEDNRTANIFAFSKYKVENINSQTVEIGASTLLKLVEYFSLDINLQDLKKRAERDRIETKNNSKTN